jgi:hypothetical protein
MNKILIAALTGRGIRGRAAHRWRRETHGGRRRAEERWPSTRRRKGKRETAGTVTSRSQGQPGPGERGR